MGDEHGENTSFKVNIWIRKPKSKIEKHLFGEQCEALNGALDGGGIDAIRTRLGDGTANE